MTSYRFSPITTSEHLQNAIVYIVAQSSALSKKVLDTTFPIRSVSVFAHSNEEYDFLCELLKALGTSVGENNGPRVVLNMPITVGVHTITHLRIRTPDTEHEQVGCNDFEVGDYFAFKDQYLEAHNGNLRLIVRPDYELIEMFDPEYDVLAYILSDPGRSLRGK